MSNSTNENLLTKIRNLLKMADPHSGASQNEMEIAMRKAQELMAQHGIEQMQLGETEVNNGAVEREAFVVSRKKYPEDVWVMYVLKKVFDVQVFTNKQWDPKAGKFGGYRHVYVIVGQELDREIAKMAIPFLFNAMNKGVRDHCKMTGKTWNTHTGNSFYRGVAEGFIQESVHGKQAAMKKFKKEEQDRFAVVLVDKKNAISAYVKENMQITYTKNRSRARHDEAAHQHGRRVGASIDFTTKLQ